MCSDCGDRKLKYPCISGVGVTLIVMLQWILVLLLVIGDCDIGLLTLTIQCLTVLTLVSACILVQSMYRCCGCNNNFSLRIFDVVSPVLLNPLLLPNGSFWSELTY